LVGADGSPDSIARRLGGAAGGLWAALVSAKCIGRGAGSEIFFSMWIGRWSRKDFSPVVRARECGFYT
jgi:hypothetical protein